MPAASPPVADPDVERLLAGLADLRAACDEDDWELAYTLMHQHDCALREVLATRPTQSLVAVLHAQHELIARMRAQQGGIARQLAALRRGSEAASRYREGAAP